MFKVIVAGSRGFNNYALLSKKLKHLLKNYEMKDVEIVSGGARGADLLGERFAKANGCKIKRFIPDWKGKGKSAGYIRNTEMAKYANACVAFWDEKSNGTRHMIDIAKKRGLQLKVVMFE